MTGLPPRYAVFFAPPADSALWAFGSAVIGYDAQTGLCSQAALPEPDWPALTEEPRRYGFHGTCDQIGNQPRRF